MDPSLESAETWAWCRLGLLVSQRARPHFTRPARPEGLTARSYTCATRCKRPILREMVLNCVEGENQFLLFGAPPEFQDILLE
jgi:hypothetical protein